MEHKLDCYADHQHEHPVCCDFKCWCVTQLPIGLCRLKEIKPNNKFMWDEKIFTVVAITPSAAWTEVIEDKEIIIKDKKTGQPKTIRTKTKRNEPWARNMIVTPL